MSRLSHTPFIERAHRHDVPSSQASESPPANLVVSLKSTDARVAKSCERLGDANARHGNATNNASGMHRRRGKTPLKPACAANNRLLIEGRLVLVGSISPARKDQGRRSCSNAGTRVHHELLQNTHETSM